MKLLVLNGPNLNLLGIREPEIYGNRTYNDLCQLIVAHAAEIGIEVEIRQSNHEGVLVDWIQAAGGFYDRIPEPGRSFESVRDPKERFDGIVLNPGAYTHTSVALLDAVLAYLPSPLDVPPVTGVVKEGKAPQIRHASDDEPFAALSFKIAADPFVGKLAFFRVYSGKISSGSYVYG